VASSGLSLVIATPPRWEQALALSVVELEAQEKASAKEDV
jgi:hypothetical protein